MLVSDIIKIAKISQYLAVADIARQPLWARRIDGRLSTMLYAERKGLEYMYLNNPSDSSIIGIANYVLSLCGEYGIRAQAILSLALVSGSVLLAPGVSTSITLVPPDIDGVVGLDPNMPVAGTSSWTNPAFIGYGVRLRIDKYDVSPLAETIDGMYFTKPTALDTLNLFGATSPKFAAGQEIHLEFYLIPSNVSTFAILTEDGGTMGGEDGSVISQG